MMLMKREPRAFLWPSSPHAESTGDVIEADLGICAPWQDAPLVIRQKFTTAWNLSLDDCVELHGRIEDALAQVSRLVTNAHHHDAAKAAGRP
eukprot:2048391-Pyramimonas_sp.AAC.1